MYNQLYVHMYLWIPVFIKVIYTGNTSSIASRVINMPEKMCCISWIHSYHGLKRNRIYPVRKSIQKITFLKTINIFILYEFLLHSCWRRLSALFSDVCTNTTMYIVDLTCAMCIQRKTECLRQQYGCWNDHCPFVGYKG